MKLLLLTLFTFFYPALSEAACPQITLDGSDPGSVRLPAEQANCSASDIFTCTRGSLRINGRVDSKTNGSVQISAYCHINKFEESPGVQDPGLSFDQRFRGESDFEGRFHGDDSGD